jgi:hypothetical protein
VCADKPLTQPQLGVSRQGIVDQLGIGLAGVRKVLKAAKMPAKFFGYGYRVVQGDA